VELFSTLYDFTNDFVDFVNKKIRPTRQNWFGIQTRRKRFKDVTQENVRSLLDRRRLILRYLDTLRNLDQATMNNELLLRKKVNYYINKYNRCQKRIMEIFNKISQKCSELKEHKCVKHFREFIGTHENALVHDPRPM
jgi:hypothetical protein